MLLLFFIVLAGIAVLAGWLAQAGAAAGWWPLPNFLELEIPLLAVTALVLVQLNARKKGSPNIFMIAYFISIVVKIFAGLLILGYVVTENPGNTPANATFFLIIYLVFTAIEVTFLKRLSRRKS